MGAKNHAWAWPCVAALGVGCSTSPGPSPDAGGADATGNQCTIGGSTYSDGTPNPENPCLACDFTKSASAWSPTHEGQSCGSQTICHDGTCTSGCFVGSAFVAASAVDPNEPCLACDPSKSTSGWSALADSKPCGNGQVCLGGKCGTQCIIAGKSIPTDTIDPNNPCDSCQPGTSTSAWTPLADGTTCGASSYCRADSCTYGCFIDGVVRAQGDQNPANPCESCDNATSATSWTNLETPYGCNSGEVCHAGSCQTGCLIGSGYYTAQTLNPQNACQRCVPTTTTTQWSNVDSASGCASDHVCHAGSCQLGCLIGNVYYASGTLNTNNACQACQPATSNSTWTNVDSATGCNSGQVCHAGSCQAGCFISSVYYADGAQNSPTLGCESCKASTSTTAWTNAADGTSCGSAGLTCTAGWCQQVIASNQDWAWDIALDASYVYWTDSADNGSIMKVPLGGGTPTTLATTTLISGHSDPMGIALDSSNVYWVDAYGGAVAKVPIGGGSQTLIATGLTSPWNLSLQGGSLYWTELTNPANVAKVSTGGGTVTTLVSNLNAPFGIVTDSTSAYFAGGTFVAKVPLGGGTVTTLATGGQPYRLAINSTDLFWSDPPAGTILSVPIGGGSTTTVGSSLTHPLELALDASNIYWTCNWCGTVSKMPIGGGTVTTLAGGLTNPVGIAVDSTYVYYSDNVKTTGRILRAAK